MSAVRFSLSCVWLSLVIAGCGGGGGTGGDDVSPDADGTDAEPPPPCAPSAACTAVASPTCLGLADNTGKATQRLRIGQLALSAPSTLGTGIVAQTILAAAQPSLAACNMHGSATFNWLLELDAGSTLKFGGAKPVTDPVTSPYQFVDENFNQLPVKPATTAMTIDADGQFSSSPANAIIPIYLDAAATNAILLPLKQVVFTGTLSDDHNCIGEYNAAGLDPGNSCEPDSTHPAFLEAGMVDGFMTLEDADMIVISALNESLCVLLSGNASMYGDNGNPKKCKRTAGTINFAGDWCSTTNSSSGCTDAVTFHGTFAASAVP